MKKKIVLIASVAIIFVCSFKLNTFIKDAKLHAFEKEIQMTSAAAYHSLMSTQTEAFDFSVGNNKSIEERIGFNSLPQERIQIYFSPKDIPLNELSQIPKDFLPEITKSFFRFLLISTNPVHQKRVAISYDKNHQKKEIELK